MKPLAGRNRTGAEYRYYVCRSRRINAADHQDHPRIPANEIDDQLRGLTETAGRVAMSIELLDSFDELWKALTAEERYDLINLLIARIDVDDKNGQLNLHLHDLAKPFPLLIDAESLMDAVQPQNMEAAS